MMLITSLSEEVSRSGACGSGYLPGTVNMEVTLDGVTPKNMTFLVCNPSSEMNDDTRLGLGLGLGLGIPAFLFILYKIHQYYKKKTFISFIKDSAHTSDRLIQNKPYLERVFHKLGSHIYRDMLLDNLTDDVKIELRSLTTDELKYLKKYAEEHSKPKLIEYLTVELAV